MVRVNPPRARRTFRWTVFMVALVLGLAVPAAGAQGFYVGTPAPNAGAVDIARPNGGAVVAPGPPPGRALTVPAVRSQGLAFTGADLLGIVLIGLVATGTGLLLVRSGRIREKAPSEDAPGS